MIILSILFLLIFAMSIYKKDFELPFEQVEQISASAEALSENEPVWFTLRDEKYGGFYSSEKLLDYGVALNDFDLDFSNYTYVITLGHKLESISFSYSKMKNRKFLFVPKQFVGIVKLQYEYSPNIYIYRIKKMDIDCDYHEPSKNIFYVK